MSCTNWFSCFHCTSGTNYLFLALCSPNNQLSRHRFFSMRNGKSTVCVRMSSHEFTKIKIKNTKRVNNNMIYFLSLSLSIALYRRLSLEGTFMSSSFFHTHTNAHKIYTICYNYSSKYLLVSFDVVNTHEESYCKAISSMTLQS